MTRNSSNLQLLGFGLLLSFLSSFGQTFLVSLYVPELRAHFGISSSLISGLFSAATLLSALTLPWLGSAIDRMRLTRFTVRVLLGAALANLALSQAYHLIGLFVAFYLLRLCGQGLASHTSMTAMGRLFERTRGRATSIAGLGHPAGEAVLPIAVVGLITQFGWRWAALAQAALSLAAIPLALWLLMRAPTHSRLRRYLPAFKVGGGAPLSRPLHLMRERPFWILAPANFTAASTGTALVFFQAELGEERGFSAAFMATSFSGYAIGSALAGLGIGFLIDRSSARRLFPLYLLPFGAGLASFLFLHGPAAHTALVSGLGLSVGLGGTLLNTSLAELYGTARLGTVRSVYAMSMVLSTAIGPAAFGLLLDAGWSFDDLARLSLALVLAATLNALRILAAPPEPSSHR